MTRSTSELYELFNELKVQLTEKIGSLTEVVLKKSDLDAIVEKFEAALGQKDKEIAKLHDRLVIAETSIEQIRTDQNVAEQYSRRQSLRFFDVPHRKGEKAEDCLEQVKELIKKLDIVVPDAVIDRAHRVGSGRGGKPAPILCKFTTWRHRSMIYRKRKHLHEVAGCRVGQDITRVNLAMMDELRLNINASVDKDVVDFVFADINCQPTIRFKDGSYKRFTTLREGQQNCGIKN
jgi:hypothetical protein